MVVKRQREALQDNKVMEAKGGSFEERRPPQSSADETGGSERGGDWETAPKQGPGRVVLFT